MAHSTLKMLAVAAVAACAIATPSHAALVYSLAGDGMSLIRFDSATPGAVTTVGSISGDTFRLDGLDFRSSDGLLYGYSHVTRRVYTVDSSTGAVTFAAALSTPSNTNFLGIDFNPVADRLRVVTSSDQNLRVNVASGATTVDGTLAYAAGDPNAGANPNIIDAAYTNSGLGGSASTTLYYVDYVTNALVSTSNPNGGVLNTVGLLGFDITADTGFDIYSDGGIDSAFAEFRVGDVNGFYSIDLSTGAATLIGAIGTSTRMYGLAVAPAAAAAVPEPASLALLGAAALSAFAVRRRQAAGRLRAA